MTSLGDILVGVCVQQSRKPVLERQLNKPRAHRVMVGQLKSVAGSLNMKSWIDYAQTSLFHTLSVFEWYQIMIRRVKIYTFFLNVHTLELKSRNQIEQNMKWKRASSRYWTPHTRKKKHQSARTSNKYRKQGIRPKTRPDSLPDCPVKLPIGFSHFRRMVADTFFWTVFQGVDESEIFGSKCISNIAIRKERSEFVCRIYCEVLALGY